MCRRLGGGLRLATAVGVRDSGFTLIETLLALLVSAAALTAGIHLLWLSILAARTARDESLATWLAQARVERLRHDGASPSGSEFITASGVPDAARGQFRSTWSASQQGAVRLIQVEVRSRHGRVVVQVQSAVWVTP